LFVDGDRVMVAAPHDAAAGVRSTRHSTPNDDIDGVSGRWLLATLGFLGALNRVFAPADLNDQQKMAQLTCLAALSRTREGRWR